MTPKYKPGQTVRTKDGRKHTIDEVTYCYVIRSKEPSFSSGGYEMILPEEIDTELTENDHKEIADANGES